MPFKPVNYGNILAQTEAIKSQRFNNSLAQQRANESSESRSLQNELNRVRLDKLRNPAPVDNSYTLSPGGARYGDNNEVLAERPFKPESPPKPPALIDEFLRARDGKLIPEGTSLQEYIALKKPPGTNVEVNTGMQQTAGRTKLDQDFAKEYSALVASGGFADITKQINQLQGVSKQLANSDTLTGPWIGSAPDWIKKFINPASISAREDVEEVVQRNLRLILGPQFTEKEGERLIARAYNENLDEATNKERVDRLMTQMTDAAKAKIAAAKYFGEHGTLTGFTGKIWTIDDFDFDDDGGAVGTSVSTSGGWTVEVIE